MKNNYVRSIQVAMLMAACGAMPMLATARGAGGMLGNPGSTAGAACFREIRGGVRNDCASAQPWIISSVNDTSGSQTFQIRAHGVPGTTRRVVCQAFSVNSDQGGLLSSMQVPTTRFDGATELMALPVGVHGFGATWATCSMDPGTVIHNAHY